MVYPPFEAVVASYFEFVAVLIAVTFRLASAS